MHRLRAVPKGNELMRGGTEDNSGRNEYARCPHNPKSPSVKIDMSVRLIMWVMLEYKQSLKKDYEEDYDGFD